MFAGPITLGSCFKLINDQTGQWSHPWIVIASPEGPEQNALCVNITDQASSDDTSCVLSVGEHEMITKESVVAYRWARVLPLAKLTVPNTPSMRIEFFSPISAEILKRIQDGGLKSDFITPRNRRLIELELGKGGNRII